MKRIFLIACVAATMATMALGAGSAFGGGALVGTPAEGVCNSINGPLATAGAATGQYQQTDGVYAALCN